MSTIKRFEDMEVWKRSMELTRLIYKITNGPAFVKDFHLLNHLRKTAVSISSNIAEGFERDGSKEFIQFLYIAKGSCGEIKCQIYIARDQKYLSEDLFQELYNLASETSIKIKKLINYLQKTEFKGLKYKR